MSSLFYFKPPNPNLLMNPNCVQQLRQIPGSLYLLYYGSPCMLPTPTQSRSAALLAHPSLECLSIYYCTTIIVLATYCFCYILISLKLKIRVKLLRLLPTILCDESRLLLFLSPLEVWNKIKLLYLTHIFISTNDFKYIMYKTVSNNWLFPGTHLELCNLSKRS